MEFRGLSLLGVILLGLVCIALAKDKDVKGPGGISIKVLGKSGKIVLIRSINVTGKGNESKRVVKQNKVMLEMDAIQEVDKGGNIVGRKSKHSLNSFANQDFTFSSLDESKFQNLSVYQLSFSASDIGGTGGNLKVTIYIFREGGEIDIGKNETDEVSKGSFKFSIEITKWKFCGDVECKQGQASEVGAAIRFTITLKSKGGRKRDGAKKKCGKKGRRCGKSYDIGEGNMTLSNEVEVDGVWKEMTDDYPKFETKGSKKSLVFLFPKFSNKAFYDPTITMGGEPIEGSGEEGPTDPSPTTDTSGAQPVGAPMALMILMALSSFFHY